MTSTNTAAPGQRPESVQERAERTIFQRASDQLWIGRVYLPRDAAGRRPCRQVSAVDRDTAVAKFVSLIEEFERGRVLAVAGYTVSEWLMYWIDHVHIEVVRPSTRRSYRRTIINHVIPRIGTRRLDRLSAQDVRRMLADIESSAIARSAHIVLRRALADAIHDRILEHNITDAVHRPRHTPATRDALDAAQVAQLIGYCRAAGDPWTLRWAAALMLGARQGELLGLRWTHVNLDAAIVAFEWQLQPLPQCHGCGDQRADKTWPCGRKLGARCHKAKLDIGRGFDHQLLAGHLALTRPKTKAGIREVPICAPLLELFTTAYRNRRTGSANPHGLVFHRDDGRPLTAAADRRNWHAVLAAAGLPDVTLHSARVTTATTLKKSGVDEQTRMALLGHVSAAAQRIYAHVDLADKHTAMAHLNQLATTTNGDQP